MLYFDIGANIGLWTLSNMQSNVTFITIEASPKTYNIMEKNLSIYNNITTLNYAISPGNEETITFYDSDADTISTINKDWLTSTRSRFYNYAKYNEIKVNRKSIDDLINEYGNPDLLKVDVEGAEHIVLKSLTMKVKLLCFEWAAEWKDETNEIIDYLYNLGFIEFSIQLNSDEYTYRPKEYEHTAESLKKFISNTINKHHFGMVWCK
jgi:FkbM family methyltransferase